MTDTYEKLLHIHFGKILQTLSKQERSFAFKK